MNPHVQDRNKQNEKCLPARAILQTKRVCWTEGCLIDWVTPRCQAENIRWTLCNGQKARCKNTCKPFLCSGHDTRRVNEISDWLKLHLILGFVYIWELRRKILLFVAKLMAEKAFGTHLTPWKVRCGHAPQMAKIVVPHFWFEWALD